MSALLPALAEHLLLVAVSTLLAVAIGLPCGILLSRRPGWRRPVLGLANVFQTVPSLALFGLLIPLPFLGGIGARTAVIALVLYALLPVIRNTLAGIEGVDRSVRDAAVAMGMTDWQVLRQVELPLAAPVILAGVRIATVISVGVATIAAAIGAGGLGTFIFRGLGMDDNRLILLGAVPAALLALLLDRALGLLESRGRRVLPLGAALLALLAIWLGAGLASTARSASGHPAAARATVVCSKDYTEQVLLGELLAQELEARARPVVRRFELGGHLCYEALLAGRVDCYPEYTGTAFTALLHHAPIADAHAVYEQVRREYAQRLGLLVGPPLGFRNDFAILVRGRDARRLGLRTISDAARAAPGWRAGFGQDFMSRPDGYAGFARAYGLRFAAPPREMDLSLTYRALQAGEVDLIAGNSTDGLIESQDLLPLEDDRGYFPPYEAVYVCRQAAVSAALADALAGLQSALSTAHMRRLNREVDGNRRGAADVVREFRRGRGP